MRFYTDEQWNRRHLSNPIERFICLRWQELFDERTYLSWQIRTSDLESICDELLDCVEITTIVHSHHPNIGHLIEEMEHSIHQNKPMLASEPQLETLTKSLKRTYEQRTRNSDVRDVTHLCSLLKKIKGLLQSNKQILLDEIELVISLSPNEKNRLYSALSLLAALLRNEGYSYFYLKYLKNVFERDESFSTRLALFRHLLTRSRESYTVHFLVKLSDPNFVQYENSGAYRIVDRNQLSAASNTPVSRFLSQDQSGTIIAITVCTLDQYSAIAEATSRLQQIMAPMSLYRQKPIISQIHPQVLVANPNGDYQFYNETSLRFSNVVDSRNFRGDFENYLRLYDRITEEQQRLLNASLKYFGVATNSFDDEIRFLNLWIALESLYQDSSGESVIARIRYSLPQVVCSNYVCDLLREIAKDIRRNSSNDRFQIIQADFPNSTPSHISPEELFTVMSDVMDGNKIRRLLEFASNNELLLHRINMLWETCFRDRNSFIKRINQHLKNVDWQILRLYRIRNSIMHKGKLRSDITYLTHHLNHYYRILIHKCINYLKSNTSHGVVDSLLSIREDFFHVMKRIEERRSVAFGEVFSFDPSNRSDTPVWEETDSITSG